MGDHGSYKSQKSQPFGGPRGLQVANVASPLGDQGDYKSLTQTAAQVVSPLRDQGAYMSQKSQAIWGTKGLKSRKPFGDQGAYKSQKSQALWETMGLKSRKPFGVPRGLQVARPKRCTSRKPFGGPKGLQLPKVASPLGDQGAYKSQKSQALWGIKGLTSRTPKALAQVARRPKRLPQVAKVASPLGNQGAYKSQ